MGRGGTQITRDAAAVILLNDDFNSILHAIAEGRQMYRNVTLFLVYLLSCNSAEIWTVLGAMIAGWDAPFSPMNILWANVIADIPPSLCLGLERDPMEDLMTDMPKVVATGVMGSATWLLIAVNGVTLSALTMAMYGTLPPEMSLIERRSEAFVMLIGLQLIMALISRSIRKSLFRAGILGNLHLLAAVIFSFALLVAGLYIPPLADLLDLQPVSGYCWIKFGVAVAVMVIVNEFFKMLIRRARL
jgi:Ca2+-transporting ATPase